jgi:hypothetical protein
MTTVEFPSVAGAQAPRQPVRTCSSARSATVVDKVVMEIVGRQNADDAAAEEVSPATRRRAKQSILPMILTPAFRIPLLQARAHFPGHVQVGRTLLLRCSTEMSVIKLSHTNTYVDRCWYPYRYP